MAWIVFYCGRKSPVIASAMLESRCALVVSTMAGKPHELNELLKNGWEVESVHSSEQGWLMILTSQIGISSTNPEEREVLLKAKEIQDRLIAEHSK